MRWQEETKVVEEEEAAAKEPAAGTRESNEGEENSEYLLPLTSTAASSADLCGQQKFFLATEYNAQKLLFLPLPLLGRSGGLVVCLAGAGREE